MDVCDEITRKIYDKCKVVRTVKRALCCKILYFAPSSSEHDFDTADLQTGFRSIDFSAARRLV